MNSRHANYRFGDRRIIIPETAELHKRLYRPIGGEQRSLVQEALDELRREHTTSPLEWVMNESIIFTYEGSNDSPIAVPLGVIETTPHSVIKWGTCFLHANVRKPGLCPFVEHPVLLTNKLTIELEQGPSPHRRIKLTRVYGGDYIPPLPWQPSARFADPDDSGLQPVEFCREFWQTHAYVHGASATMLQGGRLFDNAPKWFREPVCA